MRRPTEGRRATAGKRSPGRIPALAGKGELVGKGRQKVGGERWDGYSKGITRNPVGKIVILWALLTSAENLVLRVM